MKPRFEQAPLWKMCLGGLVYLLFAGLSLMGVSTSADLGEVIIAAIFFSPVLGALLIWEIVRAVNRRDDPREAKMPDDSP